MNRSIFSYLVLVSLMIFLGSCKDKKEAVDGQEKPAVEAEASLEEIAHVEFQCPMDCEKGKTYEEQGNCPVCKMALKEKPVAAGEDSHEEEENHDESEAHDEEGEHR
jgi:hypothetical protein